MLLPATPLFCDATVLRRLLAAVILLRFAEPATYSATSGKGRYKAKMGKKVSKSTEKALLQLRFASFFRFMAAYFSLTHHETAAKPR